MRWIGRRSRRHYHQRHRRPGGRPTPDRLPSLHRRARHSRGLLIPLGRRAPFPDPAHWVGLEDPTDRLAAALQTFYTYYRGGERMLASTLRDEPELPALADVMAPFHSYLREIAASLATGPGSGCGGTMPGSRRGGPRDSF